MNEKFIKAVDKKNLKLGEKHYLSSIKQTEFRQYEIDIRPWRFDFELLLNILNEEHKISKRKRVIEFLYSQFNADFVIILIFDMLLGKQVFIEFTGDYKDIDFPNILEIDTNSKFRNWMNYTVKVNDFLGNIILGRKNGGESFHPLQRKDFKKIGEIIANNLII